MHEYKVFKWLFGANTADDLEEELNGYAKDGWKICEIIHSKGNLSNSEEEATTIIMERKVD